MGEKINGRTPDEIKRVLEWATFACGNLVCEECPYYENVCSHESHERLAPDALAYVHRLESERDAALAKVPKWISVEERLPEDDARYMVYMADSGEYGAAQYDGDGEWIDRDFCNVTRYITHWMPLPEPPKEGE